MTLQNHISTYLPELIRSKWNHRNWGEKKKSAVEENTGILADAKCVSSVVPCKASMTTKKMLMRGALELVRWV